MSKIDFEEYRHRVNKKEVKHSLAKMVKGLERILFDGKKWVVVVLIPTIDILSNIITLLNSHDYDDDDRYDDWRY